MTRTMRPYIFAMVFFTLAACQPEAPFAQEDGPPSTDIWLYSMSEDGIALMARVTDADGYDNQPVFSPDGSSLLFSSDRSGRVNTHSYDLASGTITQLTFTDADKYSPTPIPGTEGTAISVVHSDSLTYQGLWSYSLDGTAEPKPIVNVDAVAYFTWIASDDVLFWRLGMPNTLQLINIATADTTVLAEGSVWSLHPIPGEAASAYIIQKGDDMAQIMRFDWKTKESTLLAPSFEAGKYFCITPNGDLLMMQGGHLMSFTPGTSSEWAVRQDLGITGGSRLAMSPDGKFLAVVGERSVEN